MSQPPSGTLSNAFEKCAMHLTVVSVRTTPSTAETKMSLFSPQPSAQTETPASPSQLSQSRNLKFLTWTLNMTALRSLVCNKEARAWRDHGVNLKPAGVKQTQIHHPRSRKRCSAILLNDSGPTCERRESEGEREKKGEWERVFTLWLVTLSDEISLSPLQSAGRHKKREEDTVDHALLQ